MLDIARDLKVPVLPRGGGTSQCGQTVGDALVHWDEGKCVIFDDTHKHEVWNDTDGIRVVLLLDVCRPFPKWLNAVNETVLRLAGYLPEVQRVLQAQREWEAKSAGLTTPH